jgi:hypothetical protein
MAGGMNRRGVADEEQQLVGGRDVSAYAGVWARS